MASTPMARDAPPARRSRGPDWRRTSWSERRAFAAGAILIPLVGLSLRILGVRRTLAWAARAPRAPLAQADAPAVVRAAVAAVRRAETFGFYGGTCLSRSLALHWMLGRAGVATELRFGAHRPDGRFEAHAWLERQGVPINESADVVGRMSPFRPAPTAAATAGGRKSERRPS